MPEFKVISTWLSQKPKAGSFAVSALATLAIALMSWIYWRDMWSAQSWMPASRNQPIWQAWTALFAHADEKHLLANSFLFFILGGFLAGYFGKLFFPGMAFLVGGITNLIVLKNMPETSKILGASGVVFWMGGAWLTLYFLIDQKRSYYSRSLRAIGVSLMLFFPAEAFDPNISYSAHLVGFILGVVCGLVYYAIFRQKILSKLQIENIEVIPEP